MLAFHLLPDDWKRLNFYATVEKSSLLVRNVHSQNAMPFWPDAGQSWSGYFNCGPMVSVAASACRKIH
jgi:hypothetical protein